MENNVTLKPLWKAILEIYVVFQKVCEQNHLRFYALAGTALGAARHKGFIPWDDDFDVFMPRKDYNQFFEIAEEVLPPHFRPVSIKNMSSYPFLFGKIQDVRRDVIERVGQQTGHPLNEGIFIDIFPFDGVPRLRGLFNVQGMILRLLRNARAVNVHRTLNSKIGKVLGTCLWPFYRRLRTSRDFYWEDIRRATRIAFDEADVVGMYADYTPGQFDDFFRREWFDDVVMMDFEDVKVPMPRKYHEMLTAHYGDYMTLPPEEKRVFTHLKCPPAPWKFGPLSE